MHRYAVEPLRDLTIAIARAVAVPAADAGVLADALIDADLSGTSTHGLSRLAIYVKRIRLGLIEPRATLTVDRERAGTLALDAGNGLGQVQAMRAVERLIPMARRCGVATATIRNSQHFGAASYYANKAAEQGLILLAMSSVEPAMSPAGGCEAFFGTNPIAASFPTGKGWPVKVDLATSIVARGNIIAAQKKGTPIPEGWALDPAGNPTTDASQALLGTVLTMAGHKGYALAMMVEAFSSILSGGAVGPAIGSMYKHLDRKQDVGHFFACFDVEAFMDLADFTARMDAAIDRIKACRRAPGVDEILVPGERSHRTRQRNLAEGVPVDDATVKELRALAGELNVDVADALEPAPGALLTATSNVV